MSCLVNACRHTHKHTCGLVIYYYRWGPGSTSATTALKSKLSTGTLEERKESKKYLLTFPPHHDLGVWRRVVVSTYIYLGGRVALRNVWKDRQNLSAGYVGDRQDAGRAQSPSLPLPGHYSLGNIRLWMHVGQRLVYLLNNLGSWVAFSVMRRGRLTVCRHWVDVHSPNAFFTIFASLLAFHYISTHLTGRGTQIPFVYSFVSLHTRANMYVPTLTHSRSLWTKSTSCFTHAWYLSYPWIQFPCWWNWICCINASKHTSRGGVYYNTADEWLHGFYHAIIIVITVIIWPSFGHFSKRATFKPCSVWSNARMTRGMKQIDLGKQGEKSLPLCYQNSCTVFTQTWLP